MLTFVALGGEGKTSLVAKWAAELASQDWPGCDAAFAWSFYSQGTREQVAASSDLFLKEALTFFGDDADKEFAASPAGAFEKGQRLARIVGQRRSLLILDGLEPLQYAPTSPTPGQLKDQGIAALLRGLAAASHGLCVVTTRYSLPDLRAFWQTTAPEVPLPRLSREAGVHLLKTFGVKGSERRDIPFTPSSPSEAPKRASQAGQSEAPKRASQASPGQRPGLTDEHDPALKGRDNATPHDCAAPSGLDAGDAQTQGDALGWLVPGRWPEAAEATRTGSRVPEAAERSSTGGTQLLNEFEKLVEDVKGHALTLTLLGGLLKRAFRGDIRQRDRVKFEKADALMDGGHAFRTMAAYEQWLLRDGGDEGRREVAVLRLMGLFDRPADAGCLAALRREPIPGLTDPLAGLADDDWEFCLSGLEAAKLLTVNRDATGALVSLDAHPHLREYFAKQLREQNPDAWQAGHKRLYEHLCATTKEGDQPTLEDLQPLYQAVAHGCQAGKTEEARSMVFHDRIRRSDRVYSIHNLGAVGSDLGALSYFFESPWDRVSSSVTELEQAWVLGEAAFCLRSLGRLTEAINPSRTALAVRVKQEVWKRAAIDAGNLSELNLTLGNVTAAVENAAQFVTYADRTEDAFLQWSARTTHADSLHQSGHREDAEMHFRRAEALQAKSEPNNQLLYSLRGFQYCDLLLTEAERAAWHLVCGGGLRQSHPYVSPGSDGVSDTHRPPLQACRSVSQRAAQTLHWISPKDWLLDIAIDHLTLGRAALYAAILNGSALDPRHRSFQNALEGLRRAGRTDFLPHGLLTRAWLRILTGARTGAGSAQEDLDEAWEIAERGPMKLFLADIHLHRARLFFREAKYPWESPVADLAAAEKLINECGYHRRDEELADAKTVIIPQTRMALK